MDSHHHEPQPPALLPIIRHDGWTGEKMAIFCETLAETAIVAEACAAAHMGISGAYAARRRSHVFAAAWDGALSIARERLADTLLARSMEGNIEQIYRDGELIGERHVLDNRLGLQMLRRLDRLTERASCSCGGRSPVPQRNLQPRSTAQPFDWNLAIDALRTGDDEGVAKALALVKGDKVEEVEGAPNLPLYDDEPEENPLSARCWWDDREEVWMTSFPPPEGWNGWENRDYDDESEYEPYERACTEEEAALLEAGRAADLAAERAEEAELRDGYFKMLRSECGETDAKPRRPRKIISS